MKEEHSYEHTFGGAWTEIKLGVLNNYLNFFTTALKGQNFTLLYVDAFAGSGSRTEKIPSSPILKEEERTITYDGSARIALKLENKFDRYLFIENDKERYDELLKLIEEYPDTYIKVRKDDANKCIQELARYQHWGKNQYRGVLFLDPYGNQVHWETLEAIASTKSFDVWFLFPLSGVYRQASNDFSKMEDYKKENLNKIFGTEAWVDAFYKPKVIEDMFETTQSKERINVSEMETWIQNRLEDCFTYVSKPVALKRGGIQIFSLFFCMSNDSVKAKGLALKCANHLLKNL